MNFYLGVTNNEWYNYISTIGPEDINFWQPGGKSQFRALRVGEPFLFKLKRPLNAIAGIGFFSSHTFLPISVAWEIFGKRNGFNSFEEFKTTINSIRKTPADSNPSIGCVILNNPIFFKKEDWIATPSDWQVGIVKGKSYSTRDAIGEEIWEKVELLLDKYLLTSQSTAVDGLSIAEESSPKYGTPMLTKIRLGQGAFRVLVTDSYSRKCAITGDGILPTLEAAHIQPYSQSGPHLICNGILLRSDMHKLFDMGYISISEELKVIVSKRVQEEFNNEEFYNFYNGRKLYLPYNAADLPSRKFIEWHNNNVFKY